MIDCSNAEIRDRLPELVNGRLTGASLDEVRSHVVHCALCQAEVALIERTRAMLILATPKVNTAAIAHALPTPGTRRGRQSFNWRIAAAITVLAVGGGSTALMYAGRSSPRNVDSIALVEVTGESAIAGDLSGLTDEQLRTLIGKVETIDALPAAEAKDPAQLNGIVPAAVDSHDPSGAW